MMNVLKMVIGIAVHSLVAPSLLGLEAEAADRCDNACMLRNAILYDLVFDLEAAPSPCATGCANTLTGEGSTAELDKRLLLGGGAGWLLGTPLGSLLGYAVDHPVRSDDGVYITDGMVWGALIGAAIGPAIGVVVAERPAMDAVPVIAVVNAAVGLGGYVYFASTPRRGSTIPADLLVLAAIPVTQVFVSAVIARSYVRRRR